MKKTTLFLPLVSGLLLFSSCSTSDEPLMVEPDSDMIEWEAVVSLPDDFKTRAAATGSVGADGLYTFTREINRLWYAVYYNGAYFYDSEQSVAPNAVQKGNGFVVPFKFHRDIDPTQVYIFFWAGNKEDNIKVSTATTSDAINLNFQNRCVSVNPKYMNGNNTALQEYDSFAGYVQLAPTKNVSSYNIKVTLKRPFAQIHVLSDEFGYGGASEYPNGLTVVPGFGVYEASETNYTSNLISPTTWFYDSSISLTPSYRKNEFQYTLTNYEFTNRFSGTTPERVTFKNRQMDYLGCYYVFAPIVKSPLKYAASTGNNAIISKLNLAFRKNGESLGSSEFVSVDIPSEGLQANNRYVVYNQSGNAFISRSFVFEITTSPGWENAEETQK